MKEIIVVSDSHRQTRVVNEIFSAHPDIDTCIHCGDLQDKPENLHIKNLHIVCGNNDFSQFPAHEVLTMENHRLLVTHGHYENIEFGYDGIYSLAKQEECDIALYGHTHHPEWIHVKDLRVLNPGSPSFPRGGKIVFGTYAILTLDQEPSVRFYAAKDHRDVTAEVLKYSRDVEGPKSREKAPEEKKEKGVFSFLKKFFS